jgi:hypothetical protein
MADEGGASADRGSVSAENLLEGGDATGGGELVDHDDFTDEEADTAVEDLAEAGTVVALMKAVAAVDCPAMKRLLKRADAIGCQDEVCLPPIKGSQSNIFFLAEREREREKERGMWRCARCMEVIEDFSLRSPVVVFWWSSLGGGRGSGAVREVFVGQEGAGGGGEPKPGRRSSGSRTGPRRRDRRVPCRLLLFFFAILKAVAARALLP